MPVCSQRFRLKPPALNAGTNFGTSPTVTVAGVNCPVKFKNAAGTSIKCVVPNGSGANRVVQVTAGGQLSNTQLFTYNVRTVRVGIFIELILQGPTITSIFPTCAPTTGGITLTINGNSLSTSGVTTVAGVVCPELTHTDTKITVPDHSVFGADVILPHSARCRLVKAHRAMCRRRLPRCPRTSSRSHTCQFVSCQRVRQSSMHSGRPG